MVGNRIGYHEAKEYKFATPAPKFVSYRHVFLRSSRFGWRCFFSASLGRRGRAFGARYVLSERASGDAGYRCGGRAAAPRLREMRDAGVYSPAEARDPADWMFARLADLGVVRSTPTCPQVQVRVAYSPWERASSG